MKSILILLLAIFAYTHDNSNQHSSTKPAYKTKFEGYYIRDDEHFYTSDGANSYNSYKDGHYTQGYIYSSAHLLIKRVKNNIYDIKIIAFNDNKENYNKLSFRAIESNSRFEYEEDLLPDSKFGLFLRFIDNKVIIKSRDKHDFLKRGVSFDGRFVKQDTFSSRFFYDIYYLDGSDGKYMHDLEKYRMDVDD